MLSWSLPVRGAWIEICSILEVITMENKSLPVRGAWIEIPVGEDVGIEARVAPRKVSVD